MEVEEKMPVWAQVALIVGAAIFLWLFILTVIEVFK